SDDDAPEFSDLAQEVMGSPNYPTDLAIWATYMIASTALGDPNGITTLRRATAVRINMHLYRQLNFGRFEPAPDTDDDYQE
ncbi:MAG: beta family protein, partial [Roseovarius sp.]